MARDRPTASIEHSSLPPLYAARPTAVDTLTRAETRALSRCAPLRRAADPADPVVGAGHWEVAAEHSQVGFLRRQVAAFATLAGMPAGDLPELQVAVSEALTNAVLHAYRDREFAGNMLIDAQAHTGEITIRVRDYGTGMAPRSDSPGMGLGLPIMARLTTACSVRSCEDGGTEVRMSFALAG